MKIENISNGKIIGVGEVSVLPGETKDIPEVYETSPILEVYKRLGFARIIGKSKAAQKSEAEDRKEAEAKKAASEKKAVEEAEKLRQGRLVSLDGISDEDLGKLANELGINLADCKNQADVLKKVKAALNK